MVVGSSLGHFLLFRKVKAQCTDITIETRGNNRPDALAELDKGADRAHHLSADISFRPQSPV